MNQIRFCNLTLKSPVVMSAGVWSNNIEIVKNSIKNGFGAITSKSITLHERPIKGDIFLFESYKINNLGIPNLSFEKQMEHVITVSKLCRSNDAKYILNIWATDIIQFLDLLKLIYEYKDYYDAIELNLSCPNDRQGVNISVCDDLDVAVIVNVAKQIFGDRIPIICKLPPNIFAITKIEHSVKASYADGVTCVNTIPSMFFDSDNQNFISGGMSGKSLYPISLKFVYEYRRLNPSIPIIGCGGIENERDMFEMLLAGANVVGVGSALINNSSYPYVKLLEEYMKNKDKICNFAKSNNESTQQYTHEYQLRSNN